MGLRRMEVAGGTRGAPLAALARALTSAPAIAAILTAMSSHHPTEEIFHRLLDESAARLAVPDGAGIAIPDDELHREIIVPLLPAMLGDRSIRQHWGEQAATGFPARLARHFENGDPAPRWTPGDFEIHVTASYGAGADARALADTLLSEDPMRDMTAALMNQLLDVLWPSLVPVPTTEIEEPQAAAGIPAAEIPAPEIAPPIEFPVSEGISEPFLETTPELFETSMQVARAVALQKPMTWDEVVAQQRRRDSQEAARQELRQTADNKFLGEAKHEPEPPHANEFEPTVHPPSRALIRALCRAIPAAAMQRGLIAIGAYEANAAVLSRRILVRATRRVPCGPTSRRRSFGK